MKAKSLVLVIILAALAMALTPLAFPFPALPALFFALSEVPIMVVYLLFGFKEGLFAAALNCLFLFFVWPGPSNPFLPLGSIVSWSAMMLGIYLASNLSAQRGAHEKMVFSRRKAELAVIFSIILRLLLTTPLMYVVLRLLGLPEVGIVVFLLPWLAVFNTIQTLITLPISFAAVTAVNKNFKAALGR
ncbi:MAG: hypothetical protein NWE92_03965 [Candidatus Bathyarchaeota archaeon]|nr:hypothetical protein [Candidatus Bathyarchaeota archaeon]